MGVDVVGEAGGINVPVIKVITQRNLAAMTSSLLLGPMAAG